MASKETPREGAFSALGLGVRMGVVWYSYIDYPGSVLVRQLCVRACVRACARVMWCTHDCVVLMKGLCQIHRFSSMDLTDGLCHRPEPPLCWFSC